MHFRTDFVLIQLIFYRLTQPSVTGPAGSQGVRLLADKIVQTLQKDPTTGQSGLGSYSLDSEDVNSVLFSAQDPLCKLGQDMPHFFCPHPFGLGTVSH